MRIIGVILAGGRGRRMGGTDKALLSLAGKPLIAHVLARLRPQVSRVVLSANGDPARFAQFQCDVIADTVSQGPLSGIHAALVRAEEIGATHVASVPVDTPFVPEDLVAQLALSATTSPEGLALAQTPDRVQPLCGIWPVTLAPALAAFLAEGGAKVTLFADAHHPARNLFIDPQAFVNLNTPEELEAAERLLKGRE